MFKTSNYKTKIVVTAVLLLYIIIGSIVRFPCPLNYIFGIQCFGCGMTRAWMSVLHGRFVDAFAYHGMWWSMPILYLWFWKDGRLFRKKRWNVIFLCIAISGFLFNWILKI